MAPPPNAYYLQQISDGARHHGLPEEYRAFLAGLTYAPASMPTVFNMSHVALFRSPKPDGGLTARQSAAI